MKRWQLVNEAEIAELRTTPMEVETGQLGALMSLAARLAWTEALAAEEAEVRERWLRLQEAHGVLDRPSCKYAGRKAKA